MKIEIGLSGHPSTGYRWEPDREPSDKSYLEPDPQDDDTPLMELRFGGEDMERFVFEDVPHGTDITFKYCLPFDPEVKPLKTITIHVEDPSSVKPITCPMEYGPRFLKNGVYRGASGECICNAHGEKPCSYQDL